MWLMSTAEAHWRGATYVSLEELVFAGDREARRRLILRIIVLLVLCAA